MENIRLRTRFIILFVGLIAISLTVYALWSNYTQQKNSVREMREKAYVLSQQLDAVWEFIAINQDRINYHENGEYSFKGLHCSLVGKSIGKLFGVKTHYITRYVNYDPRNKDDIADEFEKAALDKFSTDSNVKEVYELTEYEGATYFRYVIPMTIDDTCLDCHGEPAGEIDVLGYPKEGWQVGDLGGALSIIMPTDLYMSNKKMTILQEVAFFSVLMFIFILIIYYATAKLVTNPLNKLKLITEQVKMGDLAVEIEHHKIDAQGEILDLTLHFNDMIKELRTLYNDLETQVNIRTEDLAHANSILEKQQEQLEKVNIHLMEDNKYKSDFLAIMSHELRTPLTSIVAFTEILEKTMANRPDKEQQVIHEIKTNNQILLSLINNILDMAKIEAGKSDLLIEQVDLVDVINVVESVIEPLAAKKQITLITDIDNSVPIIEGDKEKLRRIVENLAGNAVKFTNNGGSVEIKVTFDPTEQMINISVTDSGIGISKEEQVLIFDKFVQGDSSIHRAYSGSGLGLALVKELTELHGGEVTVTSKFGKGSVFIVKIPIKLPNTGN